MSGCLAFENMAPTYITTDTVEHMLQNPAWSIRLLQKIQNEREQSAQLDLKIKINHPKVEFAEAGEVSAIPFTLAKSLCSSSRPV